MTEEQQLNQALRLTITDLTSKYAEESTTKNLLAVQLAESQQTIKTLQERNAELEELLESYTEPGKEE